MLMLTPRILALLPTLALALASAGVDPSAAIVAPSHLANPRQRQHQLPQRSEQDQARTTDPTASPSNTHTLPAPAPDSMGLLGCVRDLAEGIGSALATSDQTRARALRPLEHRQEVSPPTVSLPPQFPTLNADEPPPPGLATETAFTPVASSAAVVSMSGGTVSGPAGSADGVTAPTLLVESALAPSQSSQTTTPTTVTSLQGPVQGQASPSPLSPAPQASTLGGLVRITQTMSEQQTVALTSRPVGIISTHCITILPNDGDGDSDSDSGGDNALAGETFCRTLLDGETLGGDAGIGALAPVSTGEDSTGPSASSVSATVSASTFAAPSGPTSASVVSLATSVVGSPAPSSLPSSSRGEGSGPATALPAASVLPIEASSSIEITLGATVTSIEAPSSIQPSASSLVPEQSQLPTPQQNTAITAQATPTSSEGTPSPTPVPSPGSTPPLTVTLPASSASASASASPAASASASIIDAAFAQNDINPDEIPGQSMSVLPIGLGVFGGLVGVVLLVVGYMLWQRKQYREQFARRSGKLEEGRKDGMVEVKL